VLLLGTERKLVYVYSQNEKPSTGCSGAAVITVAVWSLTAETIEQSQSAAQQYKQHHGTHRQAGIVPTNSTTVMDQYGTYKNLKAMIKISVEKSVLDGGYGWIENVWGLWHSVCHTVSQAQVFMLETLFEHYIQNSLQVNFELATQHCY